MNLNFLFKSNDHLRYENGRHVSGPHGNANRIIKVEPNINGGAGYTVTLYNLDGNHPVWQNNIQMAPKLMKIIQQSDNMIVLRGYGHDEMGGSFADYGLTIRFVSGAVNKCILHMHDRNVDIEYLKAADQIVESSDSKKSDIDKLQGFILKWIQETPMEAKRLIARKTDELNNIGAEYYNQDDIENAILYFNRALEVMPINDDALKNLVICYRMTNNPLKMLEVQKKLDYLKAMGI